MLVQLSDVVDLQVFPQPIACPCTCLQGCGGAVPTYVTSIIDWSDSA